MGPTRYNSRLLYPLMLLLVICFNLSLTAFHLLLAIKLYYVYRRLQQLTQRLERWERWVQRTLSPTSDRLISTAQITQHVKNRYVLLMRRWLQVQGLWQLWQLLPKTGS